MARNVKWKEDEQELLVKDTIVGTDNVIMNECSMFNEHCKTNYERLNETHGN